MGFAVLGFVALAVLAFVGLAVLVVVVATRVAFLVFGCLVCLAALGFFGCLAAFLVLDLLAGICLVLKDLAVRGLR